MKSVKRSGIYSGLTTSRAAPTSDTLRTVHSTAVSLNSIEPVFNRRRRAITRRCGCIWPLYATILSNSLNEMRPGCPYSDVTTPGNVRLTTYIANVIGTCHLAAEQSFNVVIYGLCWFCLQGQHRGAKRGPSPFPERPFRFAGSTVTGR
jgi:hypothetical protein